jgi:DNA polymerase-3 subunit gamma/tau
MLSKQAFNGLLKTLEEPPQSLKFILATTEVRKIPVTILSRCQRFDLKRVSVKELCKHLKNISTKENGKISDDAIKLIAKTSEGSVRDSISLLDRVLISQTIIENKQVEETDVREMLGLVDRTKIISLFKEVLSGKEKEAIKYLRELINDGIDANFFLNDMLEILYLFSRRINLGPIEKDMTISENETELVDAYSKNIDMQDIGLFWQLTIKTIDDLKIVGNENIALEMYIMQLVHLKNIDAQKIVLEENVLENNIELKNNLVGENIKEENLKNDLSAQIKKQLKSTDQIKVNPVKNLSPETSSDKVDIKNFSDLMNLVNREKEVELKFDLERNVKLVSFNKGKIDISFNENLNKNFIKNLTEKLLLWSGERWIISLSKNTEAKSIYEQNIEQKSLKLMEFKKSELAKTFEDAFPDAKLTNIEGEKDD